MMEEPIKMMNKTLLVKLPKALENVLWDLALTLTDHFSDYTDNRIYLFLLFDGKYIDDIGMTP